MKLIIALCAFMSLIFPVAGCAEKKQSQAEHANSNVFTAKIDDPRFASEVAVLTPDNRFLFLKQTDLDCSGVDFSGTKLTIDMAIAIGAEWIDGKPKVGYAFEKAGTYKILTSENLETELENSYSHTFRVAFAPNKKNSSRRVEHKDLGCRINGEIIKINLP